MIRRAMVPGVLLVLGLHASLFGEIINVPGDQPSIQAAIDAAADGDEIIVAPGTYFENINLLGKAVTLHSSASVSFDDEMSSIARIAWGDEPPKKFFTRPRNADFLTRWRGTMGV